MELQIPVITGTTLTIDDKSNKAIIEGIGEVVVRYVRDDPETDKAFEQAFNYNSPHLLHCHYKFPCDYNNYTCYVIENYEKCFFSYAREITLGESRASAYVKYADNAELMGYIRGGNGGKIILTTPCEEITDDFQTVKDFRCFIDLILNLYTNDDMYKESKLVSLFRYLQSSMESSAFNKASLKNLAKNPIFLSPYQFCSYIHMAKMSVDLHPRTFHILAKLDYEIGHKAWWQMFPCQDLDYSFLLKIYECRKLPKGLDGHPMDYREYTDAARCFFRFSVNCVKHVQGANVQTVADALYSLWPEFFFKLDCILHCDNCSPFDEKN